MIQMCLYSMWNGRQFFYTTQAECETSLFSENNGIILFLLISLLLCFITGEKNMFSPTTDETKKAPFIFPLYKFFLMEFCDESFASFEKTKYIK